MDKLTLNELAAMIGIDVTQYALCDAMVLGGLAKSKGEAKRLCLQGAIQVNGKVERDWSRGVSGGDEITLGGAR